MESLENIERLRKLIYAENYIVFFGGAGVSTESGIPDFRGADGLYSEKGLPTRPEEILHTNFFNEHPKAFYEYYFTHMIYPAVKPNAAHVALAALERDGRVKAVVTQNIDGLHQQAGSKTVFELHGSVHRNKCIVCKKTFVLSEIIPLPESDSKIPYCQCGGMIKPDVVLFGEQLDPDTIHAAITHVSKASVLIVGGTSLSVYPAASLLQYFNGNALVLINRDVTPYDDKADLIIRDAIGMVLGSVIID